MRKLAWIAVAAAILTVALLSLQFLGGQGASAQGNVDFDIDPDVTGNSANTLGTVEDCVRVDGTGGFDGTADVTIDVVVQGDTQAPTAYDAWVIYEPTKVDPVSWEDVIKLPGAFPFTTKAPPQLNAAAIYFGGSGTAGDGTILRINLDIDFTQGPTTATFSFAKGVYKSALGDHPPGKDDIWPGTGMLAINAGCAADSDEDTVPDDTDNCPDVANPGQEDCNDDGVGDACDAINPGADDSDCDGIDDNCNGVADDGYVPTPTSCGVGVCAAAGELTCVDGEEQDSCTAGPPTGADDDCDGLDNDCDGTADEHYVPTPTSCGVGVCAAAGELTCVDGEEQDSCTAGPPTGADDDCDGLDNDCDGTADEHYVPTPTSCGVGVCAAAGELTCVDGEEQDSCTAGPPTGADDDCDGLDNDCDGTADEHYVPTPTSCGVGVCAAAGELTCVDGVEQDSCTAGPPTGADDDCDGLDNDCDGTADEHYVPTPTSCGVGVCAAAGELTCVDGEEQDSCTAGPPTGADDDCDGLDNDCDGTADEHYVPTPTSCGVGVCAAAGELTCVDGVEQDSCTVGPPTGADDDCDGLDNDCDGTADEHYVPTPTSCGVGECAAAGELTCVDGEEQDSCTAGPPTTEVCDDGLDNDCDGLTDGDDPDCGAPDSDGDGWSDDIDNCPDVANPGQEDCNDDGVGDACDAINPGADDSDCDGIDDNCNGVADDEYIPTPTSCGVGECAAAGELTCVDGEEQDSCTAGPPTGADDDCDGLDNDCDGTADEHYVPTPTSCGVGVCAAAGELTCVDGVEQDSCTAGPPTGADDDCDGLDNDCDGTADEHYVPTPTSCGVGVCAAAGELTCVDGEEQDSCTAGPPTGADDDCDGLDNDCDGTADEHYVPTPTSCGVGVCAAAGELTCVDGEEQDSCTVGPPTGADDDCDGLDNDCDGTADEHYVPTPTSCGVGVCAAAGELTCVDGEEQDSCTAGPPTTEVCDDGLDNDCDGLTDGADPDCGAPPEELTIDIKPGSDPNPINLKSKGVIPVAILTTDAFDASNVDPPTADFEGASPVRWSLKDVDHDGDLDLLLHFRTQETSIVAGQVEACLTATTFDGITLQGCDSIKVVPAKGGGNHGGLLALGAPLALLGIGLGRNSLRKMGQRLRRHA